MPEIKDSIVDIDAEKQFSFNGLNVISGIVHEECNADLRWPACINTYKTMMKDATIAPTLNILDMYISKVEWTVQIPEGHEDALKEKKEFLEEIMDDMESSWGEMIFNASGINRYGFAPLEKVYRRRTYSSGSKYNDGLWGIYDLPLIAQDTIEKWLWSADGKTLKGLEQRINIPSSEDDYGRSTYYEKDTVVIPRNKFLLFRTNAHKDSPVGESPLNAVYIAWRFKTELEKFEATSVANDVRGLKVIKVPAQYLSASATPEEKKTAEYFKDILRGLHNGEQSGVLLPNVYDDNGKPMFEFEVVSVMGQKANSTHEIINRYKKEIVTGLLNPLLILGQDGSGSFALSQALSAITDSVVESRLKEIKNQLNHDLIPQLFKLNGWSAEITPTFEFNRVNPISTDDLGKYIQRVAAAGMLHNGPATANWIASQAGMPAPFGDVDIPIDEVREQMTKFDSHAGEGMETASGYGTSSSSATEDTSISNLEN